MSTVNVAVMASEARAIIAEYGFDAQRTSFSIKVETWIHEGRAPETTFSMSFHVGMELVGTVYMAASPADAIAEFRRLVFNKAEPQPTHSTNIEEVILP